MPGRALRILAAPLVCAAVSVSGGSGNGPAYTGRVRVVGPDEYDLDRDNDGIGCESG
ncbi:MULTISPECIES: hypothetical protein [Nocardia]|nr:hypothetical protein [Nocardia farcinica]MBF6184039.1 hypothetical protein [Nocardia farcinica]MBF6309882.1 hypothetical protein [Nocardia farcinica]MBF6376291.1 hypothetical protein [Nocardia farcinica]MBF6406296.1 hypothetical protein [Nocardia farcinica]